MFGTIKATISGSGRAALFWLDMSHYLHSQGFRFLYGRCSNIKSFSLLTDNRGYKLAKIKVMENDKILTLSFIRFLSILYTIRDTLSIKIWQRQNCDSFMLKIDNHYYTSLSEFSS